jgi:hypothetical protein
MMDPGCRLVVAQRTPAPFNDLLEIVACFDNLERMLTPIDRGSHKLLVDVRRGPSRNDDAFEMVVAKHRKKLLGGFARNAALAATAAGSLQIQRYAKVDERQVLVTSVPEEAFAHLGLPAHALA